MTIMAIIRHDYELLLVKSLSDNKTEVWTLPHFEISDDEDPSKLIIEKCRVFDVYVNPISIYFHEILNGREIICFDVQLLSYTYYSKDINNARWVDTKMLEQLHFVDEFSQITNKLINEYHVSHSINDRIESVIDSISNDLQLKTEKTKDYSLFNVFVRSDYGNYCPFVFSVQYCIDFETYSVDYKINWHITRMFADGDKTDLYVLFTATMPVLLKCIHLQDVYIDYLHLFDNVEISAASILFAISKNNSIDTFINNIDECFAQYALSLMMFEVLIGSFSLKTDNSQLTAKYEKVLNTNNSYNFFSREEHQFYGNSEEGIFAIHINNHVYRKEHLLGQHDWQLVGGIDGKILHQIDGGKSSYNFVSNEIWCKIQELIKAARVAEYSIVCQQNILYLLADNDIWMFHGDFSEYKVCQERDRIFNRQAYENSILHFNRTFKWKYPVDPGRFENLVADLIETEPTVDSVRLVGNTNHADGGRDILIFKSQMKEPQHYISTLIVGQCKAYQKTINKNHVQDIRDMLEYYSATGFFLAVSSHISTPLIDHLCKLKETYEIDWWTERELFRKLRQHPEIANEYEDIVEIIEK